MIRMKKLVVPAAIGCLVFAGVGAHADYFNGFETDTVDWVGGITRVPSGTNGITSKTGSYHAEVTTASTHWGGYSSVFQPYTTSLDVYLDVSGSQTAANDSRFDWSSAINKPDGTHRRDFVFNGGFYKATDLGAPGGGVARFIFSASNDGLGWPKNPGRDPFAITSSGWYTLSHSFYDNSGVLAVDLSIANAGGSVLHTWTLSDPTDLIGVTVGGNRYGWFDRNQLPLLAIDNARLQVVPEPAFFQMGALIGMSGLGLLRLRKRTA